VPQKTSLRRDAKAIFRAALAAAHAGNAVRAHLSVRGGVLKAGNHRFPLQAFDRVFLIAVGKAAVEMAAAVETIVGSRLTAGIAITKHGHANRRLRKILIIEAGHPIPDAAGIEASHQVRDLLREPNARDLLIVAVSGGASALLTAPTEPITLAAKQKTTDLLLRAGAVIGDPLDVIGSGPTAPDPTTFADATRVLEKFNIVGRTPKVVLDLLQKGARGEIAETPKPGDPLFENVYNIVAGSNALALKAAAREARALGYRPCIVSNVVSGEAREVARKHIEILRKTIKRPACLLAGGETTVTVKGKGKGGRNQEFALAAAIAMDRLPGALALCAGTDGTDGPTDAAGAIATGNTIARATRLGLDPAKYLANNDSYSFFEALGDLVKTGPTGTNVMDIEILLAG
jgi:glycerate 2-kinase